MDMHIVVQCAQLFQVFGVFQLAWVLGDEVMQEVRVVGIDVDMMAIRYAGWQYVVVFGKGIVRLGQWCVIEGQGQVIFVGDHFDHIGVEQRGDVFDGFGQGGDIGLWVGCQVGCYLIDDHRWNKWFVILYVDHDGIGWQVELGSYFGQMVGVGVVIFIRFLVGGAFVLGFWWY